MKLKRRKIKRGRIEIIPMIDTIVILLIFYMTFSRFATAEKDAAVKLAKSRAGDEFKGKENQVVVNMFSKDKLKIDENAYTMEQLPGFLQGLKLKDPKYAHMKIVLRGDSGMSYADLSAFMKACSKAKVSDVTFTTAELK